MEEVNIYRKGKKMIGTFIMSLYTMFLEIVFLGVGFYDKNIWLISFMIVALIITIAIFSVHVYHLIVPRPVLTLNEDGLIDCTTFPVIGRILWEEVEEIYSAKILKKTSIYIKLKDNEKLYGRLSWLKRTFIKANTPKKADPVVINLSKTDENIDEVLDILKAYFTNYKIFTKGREN
ncbi:MAG TPA: hypothetical protein GXZ21_00675 [Clostridiales bacterium]|nr:hypothetical protein [Clostridiales bacterium]